MKKRIFPRFENTYRGNLHTHTTRSDGAYELDAVLHAYQDMGYQFLCISDHRKYYVSNVKENENFIILDGMEGEVGDSSYHIHAIADYSAEEAERFEAESIWPVTEQSPQETINEYIKRGNICIINHPRWTKLEYEELMEAEGYLGIEIYNHNCDRESLTGYATDYWDYLLRKGKRVYGFASDDAHAKDIHCNVSEYFGGWICVSAEGLSQKNIVNSMKTGDFYASNGPAFLTIDKEDRIISLQTSPVKSIAFISWPEHGVNVYDKSGKDIREAVFTVPEGTQYVRIEITDQNGKKAWSNPLFF